MLINEGVRLNANTVADEVSFVTFRGPTIFCRSADCAAVVEMNPDPRSSIYTGDRSMVNMGFSGEVIVRENAASARAKINASLGTGGLPFSALSVHDQKVTGTDGGSFISGAFQTRDLNTIVTDPGGLIVSLAGNQLTIKPGTYLCGIFAPAHFVSGHTCRLQNITLGTTVLLGSSEDTAAAATSSSKILGRFSIPAQTVFEVQHQCSNTRMSNGFGAATGFQTEVYTELRFARIQE